MQGATRGARLNERLFASPYARLYDAMYATKDYSRECDTVEGALRRYGDGGPYRRILDLGCGTGNHAIPLVRRGYEVTGVDLSADMVALAREKAVAASGAATFEVGDLRTVDLGRTFDAVLILFAVLGYLVADEDIRAGLRTARRHLRPGGLLVLDVWNAATVHAEGVRDRISVVESSGRQVIKASLRTLDPTGSHVNVRVRAWQIEGTAVVATADEAHRMRPFARFELERFLRECGFQPRTFFAFPDLDAPLQNRAFDIGAVAQAP